LLTFIMKDTQSVEQEGSGQKELKVPVWH